MTGPHALHGEARSGWAEAFAADPAPEIDEETAEWLEAPLTDDEDWEETPGQPLP
jgi:hypothetical protein